MHLRLAGRKPQRPDLSANWTVFIVEYFGSEGDVATEGDHVMVERLG